MSGGRGGREETQRSGQELTPEPDFACLSLIAHPVAAVARKSFIRGPYHLGAFSMVCGVLSCCWVAFITVLFVLPTVYPGGPHVLGVLVP